jgi:hypothetical protein
MKTDEPFGDAAPLRYSRPALEAKGKTVFSSDSKLIPGADWNESNQPLLRYIKMLSVLFHG